MELITSLQNPRIKALVRLHDGSHRRRQGLFLVEGRREVERAWAGGWKIETLYLCESEFTREDDAMASAALGAEGVELVQLAPEPFAKASHRESPDGWLAVVQAREVRLDALQLPPNPLLLVVERVEKPGNLGALLRTADAAGVAAVLVCDPVCDLHNPHAIRASQGAFFSRPVVVTDNTTARLWLEARGIRPVVTSPAASGAVWQTDLRGPVALAVGAEDTGLSSDWLDGECVAVSIPMQGLSDSLNVNVAAAVVLFEAVRQRTLLV